MKPNLWLRKCSIRFWQSLIGMAVLLSPACGRADPTGGDWSLVFSDDFNGTTLDTNKWNTCYWWDYFSGCTNAATRELQWYQPDDVIVQNGILRLRAQSRSIYQYSYTSGMIITDNKFAFQYGYAEIRAKLPKGNGLWPAFWLAPVQRNVWPPEIDIMENLGVNPYRVYMTLHYSTSSGNQSSTSNWTGPDFSAGYHTFAVQWDPERIIWYVDGVERQRYEDAENIPAQPMQIIANLAVGEAWSNAPPDDTTPFPSYYDIDYIKVWRHNSRRSTPTVTSIITETEGLTIAAKSDDTYRHLAEANFSNGIGNILHSNAENDYVTYTVNVPEARTFNVKVGVKKYRTRGKFQFAVNGVNYGSSHDLYAASPSFVELDVANIKFDSSGNKSFQFIVTDKNANSQGYTLGFDYIKLIPK